MANFFRVLALIFGAIAVGHPVSTAVLVIIMLGIVLFFNYIFYMMSIFHGSKKLVAILLAKPKLLVLK
jgi:uncharacterized membrane protein HdeD (DUF308 family)